MSLPPRTRVGPYEISSQIGAGGMGEVYRARDTRLARDVAIKILPARLVGDARALERFRREARAVGGLNHPHICTLFDAGEHEGQPFLVMELLDGETLFSRMAGGKPVPAGHALQWTAQLADALGAAHERGIIHRDLKPANIFITTRGDAKILDFGIAKIVAPDGPADATTMAALTSVGTAIGTAAYMSPEQIRSDELDERADLFSLGVVLYEAAAGKHPFGGSHAAVVASILSRVPDPIREVNPAAPEALERIIHRLLEKDRELRYQRASDLRADVMRALREAGGAERQVSKPKAEPSGPKAVAVLPFRNIGGDPDHAFFSDGLAEDLIDALSRIPAVHVASRASAFRFRDPDTPAGEIGAALNVSAIVQGSVRRAGETLRVTAQLIDAKTGFQLWSEKYDREMSDLFDIQDDIVAALAAALAPALTGGGTAPVRRPTDNLEAYEWYLKGRHYWHQRSPSTLRLAIQSFEQAIALDADYALAYAGLADSWALYRPYGWLPVDACKPPAARAVERALALAPDLPEVQFSKGLHEFYFSKHWRQAGPYFKRAAELNPRSSLSRAYYGVFLASEYRLEAARVESAASVALDPLSPFVHGIAGLTALAGGDVAGAEAEGRRALELQPDYLLAFWMLAITLDNAGKLDDAEAMIGRAIAMSRAPIFVAMLAKIHARQGRIEQCAAIEQELEDRRGRGEYVSRACDVVIATGRDDVEGLRRALRACVIDDTSWFTVRLGPGPGLESFRSDPEVNALLDTLYDGARPKGAS